MDTELQFYERKSIVEIDSGDRNNFIYNEYYTKELNT